jgi:hypothetical protein
MSSSDSHTTSEVSSHADSPQRMDKPIYKNPYNIFRKAVIPKTTLFANSIEQLHNHSTQNMTQLLLSTDADSTTVVGAWGDKMLKKT